jgi:predicted phage tail protein
MKKVRLLGELGKKFGKVIELDVKTPAEAVRALCINFPEFKKFVSTSEDRNIGYRVIVGKKDRSVDELDIPTSKSDIKIVPVLMGSKRGGIGQIIVGAILIAGAFVGNYFFPGNPVSPYLMNAGVALIAGGVVQLLTPLPSTPDESPENRPSYIFNGSVNTSAQGYPVPVGYGRMIVGSAVISAGIDTDNIPV